MKSVWLIEVSSMDVSKNTGIYPTNGKVIAVCDTKDTAVQFANMHISHSIEEARDFYNGEGVQPILEELTTEELIRGSAFLRIDESIEPHDKTEYFIRIKEWAVLEK